jgi:hypothetical protein
MVELFCPIFVIGFGRRAAPILFSRLRCLPLIASVPARISLPLLRTVLLPFSRIPDSQVRPNPRLALEILRATDIQEKCQQQFPNGHVIRQTRLEASPRDAVADYRGR